MQYNISHQSGDCIVSDGSSDESSITYRVNESQVKMNDRQESATKPHPHHAVAEFLFQLTKMLQDDNRVYIEWINGKSIQCAICYLVFLELVCLKESDSAAYSSEYTPCLSGKCLT